MIENNPNNVASAFEMLLEEVEAEIDFVTGVGSRAFAARATDRAREAADRADALTAFRDRVAALRKEWEELAKAEEREDEQTRTERRDLGKLRKGLRTPTEAYFQPILRTLDEMGGSGKVSEVLDRVGEIMKPVLKDVDYQPLASNPENPRWRNAAQWARNTMRQDGLIKDDSPHGTWEISDKGRAMLKRSR
jgi:restriction system protein